mmetsp:Transcript_14183/g.26540  ORF Transcript_14183/g.26540 Transcript_14183/m.26540 type:complete len:248 (-) Transcript_14183:57-800(-)
MKVLSSDAIMVTTLAISVESPALPTNCLSFAKPLVPSASSPMIFVATIPGATALTRVPSSAASMAAYLTSISTAALLAEYMEAPENGARATLDMILVLTITDPFPGDFFMAGRMYLSPKTTLLKLESNILSMSSFLSSTIGFILILPALRNAASSCPPNALVAAFTIFSQVSSLLTSPATITTLEPSASTSLATCSSLDSVRDTRTIPLVPSRANSRAVAFPMPELAPVTIATFPSSFMVVDSFCCG